MGRTPDSGSKCAVEVGPACLQSGRAALSKSENSPQSRLAVSAKAIRLTPRQSTFGTLEKRTVRYLQIYASHSISFMARRSVPGRD